jgi:hypothetical protein
MQKPKRLLGLGAGAALLAGAAVAILPGATAWAASNQVTLSVCAFGGYSVSVSGAVGFSDPPGICETTVISSGQTVTIVDSSNGRFIGTVAVTSSEAIEATPGDDYEIIPIG